MIIIITSGAKVLTPSLTVRDAVSGRLGLELRASVRDSEDDVRDALLSDLHRCNTSFVPTHTEY